MARSSGRYAFTATAKKNTELNTTETSTQFSTLESTACFSQQTKTSSKICSVGQQKEASEVRENCFERSIRAEISLALATASGGVEVNDKSDQRTLVTDASKTSYARVPQIQVPKHGFVSTYLAYQQTQVSRMVLEEVETKVANTSDTSKENSKNLEV